ncbi:MAG: hypothetical protein KAY37_03670 [Phycisphaerae bacterium]|nr:hypothetical protein [Phycisphaerae bacterium]
MINTEVENTTADPAAAERKRVVDVMTLTEDHPTIQATAVAEGWDVAQTEKAVLTARVEAAELQALRAGRPDAPNIRSGTPDAPTADVLAAAVLLRAGRGDVAEKELGEHTAQRAADLRARSLLDLCASALHADGVAVPSGRSELIRAAFSTSSLPEALGASAEKIALSQYRATQATWRSFCRVESVQSFRDHKLIRAMFGGGFRKVAPGGELKHGTLGEEVYSVRAETSGMMLGIDRHDIINDDLSVFAGVAASMGRAAARAISDEVFKILLLNKEPDGSTDFFTPERGNYVEGVDTALGVVGLAAAVASMIARTDSEGRPVDLAPRVLLVPPELDRVARELLTSQSLARYVSEVEDAKPEGNPFGNDRLVQATEPRLSNATFTGSSLKSWYLFPQPADGAVVVGFLDGRDQPVVEQIDPPANKLGVQFRAYLDFGVSLADWRAAHKAKGEA